MQTYIVAFYEVDRAYGGAEEGGWWFDCGTLARVYRTYKNQEAAYKAARRANDILRVVQSGMRDVGSMAYSGGRYAAYVYENYAPRHFPETKPYYE